MNLRTAIVVTICGIVFLSSTAMTTVFVTKSQDLVEDIAVQGVETEADLLKARLEQSLAMVAAELSTLSHLTSVRLVADKDGANTDGQRSSTRPVDHVEIASSLFSELLGDDTQYSEIRLVTVDGHELIGSARDGEHIHSFVTSQTRSPTSEPALQSALPSFPQRIVEDPEGHHAKHYAYVSELTLSHESMVARGPGTAELSFFEPVYSIEGELAGVLIISADCGRFITEAFKEMPINHRVIVFNENFDYLRYDPVTGSAEHEVLGDRESPVSGSLGEAMRHVDRRIEGDDVIAYQARAHLNGDPSRFIGVLVEEDRSVLRSGVTGLETYGLLLSLGLVGLALVIAWLYADRLTKPLDALTNSVVRAKANRTPLDVTTTRNDEIGTLARAFQGLYSQLSDSELKSRLILDNVGDGIIAIHLDGTIVDNNPAVEQIFGYETGELKGQSVSCLMPSEGAERLKSDLARYAETGKRTMKTPEREEMGKKRSGEYFPVELTVTEAVLKKETLFIATIKDISERKAVEKAKSEFLAVVSHELRTPLSSIIGALRLLDSTAEDAGGEQRKLLLDVADRNSKRLQGLVEDILEFESFSTATLRLDWEVLDLGDLLDQTVKMLAPLGERAGVSVTNVSPKASVRVRGDEKRLLQAVTNLLINAVKFSERGQDVRVGFKLEEDGRGVAILVEDHGAGIPENDLERIFDSFVQVDSSAARKAEGVGLGLAIAQKIVQAHRGRISVESEVDVGTTFQIRLPLYSARELAA